MFYLKMLRRSIHVHKRIDLRAFARWQMVPALLDPRANDPIRNVCRNSNRRRAAALRRGVFGGRGQWRFMAENLRRPMQKPSTAIIQRSQPGRWLKQQQQQH